MGGPSAANLRPTQNSTPVAFERWRRGADWRKHRRMRMIGVKRWSIGGALALALPLGACISHTRPENAALPQPWPKPPPDLEAYGPPAPDYPSVGGDILKGSTPADLAAARAAAFRPLDMPDTPDQPQAQSPPPPPPH